MELISVDLNKNMVELNVEDDSPKNECVSYRFANGFFSLYKTNGQLGISFFQL